MWLDQPDAFAKKYIITIKGAALFKCTAEHLLANQDGGKDVESNIVAACHFCNQKRHKCKNPKDPIAYKHYISTRLCKGKWNSAFITRSHISSNMWLFKISQFSKQFRGSVGFKVINLLILFTFSKENTNIFKLSFGIGSVFTKCGIPADKIP